MKFLAPIVVLVFSLNISASLKLDRRSGEWGSGGGNALVCFKGRYIGRGERVVDIISEIKKNNNTIADKFVTHIKSIEMFDLYEARKIRGLNREAPEIVEIQDDEEIYDYLERLSIRFHSSVPIMSVMVSKGKELIPDSQLVFHDFALHYQNDLGNVTLPSPNCVIATMAAQVNESNYYVVHIDQRLYDHPVHSYQSKATLILHELLYGFARNFYQHHSSGATRNLIRYYISYHPSFTEGAVSKAVYDLGFIKEDDEELQMDVVKQYRSSYIMDIISSQMELSHQYINRLTRTYFNCEENKILLEDILALIKANEGYTPIERSLYAELKWVKKGILLHNNDGQWSRMETRLYTIFEKLQNEIGFWIINFQDDLLRKVKTLTHISDNDYDNLTGHLTSLFGNSFHVADRSRSSLFFRVRWGTLSSRNNKIFADILNSQICINRNSSSHSFVVRPEDKFALRAEGECYDTIKLDNIIPKY